MELHEDRFFFKEAVAQAQRRTGFLAHLIEKDYFISLALAYLTESMPGLVFKGGTCLTKVLVGFYRLSEDLDFTISTPVAASRSIRSNAVSPVKVRLSRISNELSFFSLRKPLTGANNSTQYIGEVVYHSVLTGALEPIKIEISLREPLFEPVVQGIARTLLQDPVRGQEIVKPIETACIAGIEAYAEKFRAAMTRKDPAIRDYFDIGYAVNKQKLNPDDPRLVELVRIKLNTPDKKVPEFGEDRIASLKRQINAQLRPILREDDYNAFDFETSWGIVSRMAEKAL